MTLQQEIREWRGEIKTSGYDMSIGELMSLYRDNELILRPKFQRFFRWTIEQKSKFIESILLGIPIPSIFVAQQESGVWDVIDGLQRLSTILEFAGLLKDAKGNVVPPLVLEGTRYLPLLKGKTWGTDEEETSNTLSSSQRIDIKRAKISVNIVLKESMRFTKYELFQRLNTGASLASDQEVRNCMLIDTNETFFDWFEKLADDENFKECVRLSDKKAEEQYHLELVSRFLVFRQMPEDELKAMGYLGDFLDEKMLALAGRKDFDSAGESIAFRKTFELLNTELGGDSFRRYDSVKDSFRGGFLISAFEGVALGVGYNIDRIIKSKRKVPIPDKVKQLWANEEFRDWSGVGRSAGERIAHSIKIGRLLFRL